ncbi:MAG: hypothetical protein IT170_05255 [Bryobacterales bacterium]|nr:hypothetical protein [Bryobacterales bacterium]
MRFKHFLMTALAAGCLLSTAATAETSKTVTKEGKNGGTYEKVKTRDGNGTITTDKTVTSANGKTASSSEVRDVNGSDGQRGYTSTKTGPNGKSRTESQTWTKNDDGTRTRARSATGRAGKTRSATLDVGNGQATNTVVHRNGTTTTRTRTRRPR